MEPSIVVYCNYKKFGPTTLQVWLLFLAPHPHFWKVYARFPDEEFNTESISTNLNPKNEKQKSLYALFYFLFFILFWGHFNKTMLFPFFLTISESVRSRKITQFKQKKCSWIIFKGKGFRAERKNVLFYFIPQHLKRWFFFKNRPIHFHINRTTVIKSVKQNQLSFPSNEINKPLLTPVHSVL